MSIYSSIVPIKIECGCGQRYAFDVENSIERMPSTICCPICGTDGTAAANAILAQRFQSPPPALSAIRFSASPAGASDENASGTVPTVQRVSVASIARVAHFASPESAASEGDAVPVRSRLPGQLDPEQARLESRAKIMWGDDPTEVSKFLRMHGFTSEEAQSTLAPLLLERKDSVRKAGINKVMLGTGMMCLPVIAWFFFKAAGYLPLKIFSFIVAVGVWGVVRTLNGAIMYLTPKGERGDVANM
jgi:hypothetical protein